MKHRRDNNQKEIVAVFEKMGATVFLLDQVGGGCPDLLVGVNGVNLLVEVKNGKRTLTPDQYTFFETWRGQKIIVRTIEEAIMLVQTHRY